MEASQVPTTQPCVIVRAFSDKVKDVFLLFEKKIMGKISVEQGMLALFASFYALNVHFPNGCSNFYLLLECLTFSRKVPGRKSALMAELSN